MYEKLQKEYPEIISEAKRVPEEIGMPDSLKGKIGLTGAISGMPRVLGKDVRDAIELRIGNPCR